MSVRTTVDIPQPLHELLRRRAERSGASIRSLIVQAIEQAYREPKKGKRVTGPMIKSRGKRGPAYPVDANPHDLVFSCYLLAYAKHSHATLATFDKALCDIARKQHCSVVEPG